MMSAAGAAQLPDAGSERGSDRGRLLIVSNRLPVTVRTDHSQIHVEHGVGGLATALRGPHMRSGGWWIGWAGDLSQLNPDQAREVARKLESLRARSVSMSRDESEVFYEHIANGILWPVLHDRLDQVPMNLDGWETYERVNARFADAVADIWQPGDFVWVHDYQMMRLPALLRERRPEARIGFFLHAPFPNPEIFLTLPVRRWLVDGLLGADVIGFHTRRYRGHFTAVLRRLVGLEMDADAHVRHDGKRIRLGIYPMGVDAQAIYERASDRSVSTRVIELKNLNERLLVGVDRLDYSKGIVRRLASFERLLEAHPEWVARVRLLQVAVPSRSRVGAYQTLRADVERMVGRINGRFGTPSWTPIQYIQRAVTDTVLYALYRAADVMLVTPLRDGMNLVAKEFVACRGDEDGTLILSEFAGAADELKDAVIVNPYDVNSVAEAIHGALTMDGTERRRRMRRLREHVMQHDVHEWARTFMSELALADGPARE